MWWKKSQTETAAGQGIIIDGSANLVVADKERI